MLNIIALGSCAHIYAKADVDEPLFNAMDSIKIWHNNQQPSLSAYSEPKQQYSNDLCLSFESSVPFVTFCEEFSKSEYNNPDLYHMMTHNCADSALFALRLAGIQLDLPLLQFGRFYEPSYFLRLPGITLTPLALFEAAKEYKIQQLQNSPLNRRFNRLVKQLFEQIQQEINPARQIHTQTIIQYTIRCITKRPHQLTVCTDTLATTHKLLTHDSATPDYENYLRQSCFFKRRVKPIQAVYLGAVIDKSAIILLARWLVYFASAEAHLSYVIDFIAITWTLIGIYSLILDMQNKTNAQAKPTQLSSAMVELVHTVAQAPVLCDGEVLKVHTESHAL
ncbi:hypothetical protein LEWO105114_05970 [Legionella worsleiensis]|uniref:Uncharacterized protein n=2 Tax=Legionella worsleiensis TaxID=45076 RepID=A0A0W1A6L4_9GAMM|nr:hypothetical protein Lwor_2206 [Legionella worsleiensis]STY33347.1 Uncharacterised protein [Legionella worsleiensis]